MFAKPLGMVVTLDWTDVLLPISKAEYLATCPRGQLERFAGHIPDGSGAAVCIVEGGLCPSRQALFHELGEKLDLPDDCRPNWRSLEDCLEEMAWLPASTHALFITDVDRLLCDAESDFHTFVRALTVATRRRNARPVSMRLADDDAPPLHVIFHCEREARFHAMHRLNRAGLEPTVAVPWNPALQRRSA
jgi:hypothetical protein